MSTKFSKLGADSAIEVRAFVLQDLAGDSSDTFRTPSLDHTSNLPKAKRTALPAPTDDQKSRRFAVDPVLRDLLSVDEDTESEVDRRVEAKLAELAPAAEAAGREAGYEEGYARGEAEAKASFGEASRERLERMDAFLQAAEGMKTEIFQANERFLVELVFKIAENILQREISSDADYVSRIVRSVVEKVGVKEQLKLIANASQLEALYALLPELEKKHSGLKNISIEASSQLGDADIVLETDWNRVDATLASQLDTLHTSLVKGLEESQASEGDSTS